MKPQLLPLRFVAAVAVCLAGGPGLPAGLSAQSPPPNGPGWALQLDGADDYVRIPDSPALRFGNKFTIEFWFKPASLNQGAHYLVARCSPDTSKQTTVAFGYSAPNNVEFYALGHTGEHPQPGSALTLPDTGWHHIAYSYDGATWSGYLDGAQVFSVNRVFNLSTSPNDWLVGTAFLTDPNRVAGQFDEIRLWNLRRSGAQIQEAMRRQLFGTETGLVGYWRFDEGTGSTAVDAAGNNVNTATLVSGPAWIESTIAPFAPPVATLAASSVTGSRATLNGMVDGRTSAAAFEAYFEWGETAGLGNELRTGFMVTPGAAPQNFSAPLTGLMPGTTYYFRAVAANNRGASYGATRTILGQGDYTLTVAIIAGGGSMASGGGYNLSGTIGQWDANPMTTVTEGLNGGFWNTEVLPALRIQRTGNSVVIAWLASLTGFQLQQSPAIAGPQMSWGNVTQPVTVVNGENQVTFNNLSGNQFFRLRKP